MMPNWIVEISDLKHVYPASDRKGEVREALRGVDLSVDRGEIFGLLGPNGGGKTTVFRILSTSMRQTNGTVLMFGLPLGENTQEIRNRIGVVFQSPSLDQKLTVEENLRHQGHLYGLRGKSLAQGIDEMLARFQIGDRKGDMVETLSGGLQRRVELAKGLLHGPELLLLDEPSTGLDPSARRDLWRYLAGLRESSNVTVLLTTHIMEEADGCDRVGIMDRGEMVVLGSPDDLKNQVGKDVISVSAGEPESLRDRIEERFGSVPSVLDGVVRIEHCEGEGLPAAGRFITQLIEAFPGQIESISVSKPTLEDVFIHHTGHRFEDEGET